MKNPRALLVVPFLAYLWASLVLVPACATVSAIAGDVKSCAAQEADPVLKDLESGSVQAVEDVLSCDPNLDPTTLAPCVESGLKDLALRLGPDGENFVQCVTAKVEGNSGASASQRANAGAARAKLFRKPGWSRS